MVHDIDHLLKRLNPRPVTTQPSQELRDLIQSAVDAAVAPLAARMALLESYLRQTSKQLHDQDALLATLIARDRLAEGLLPDLKHISLIEAQIFDNHWENLSPTEIGAQRKARHGPWSARLTVTVNGKRFGKSEINVALVPGAEFALQVKGYPDVPDVLQRVAEFATQRDAMFGMFKRLTSGAGTPRSLHHFMIVEHYRDAPQLTIWSHGEMARSYDYRPAGGTKATSALWYAKCRPVKPTDAGG